MLTCDSYLRPETLGAAFDALEANGGHARIVAGATDILPWAREGRAGDVHIPVLIDVAGIPELRVRERRGARVRLGAATPFQRFLDDPMLVDALPGMKRCAVWFADDQIRESATIGGNLVNASPAADGTPPLLMYDTVCRIVRRRAGSVESRDVPLRDFMLGPGRTVMERDDILLGIECEALPGYGGAFEKVGHRRSLVISVVCVAAAVKLDRSGERFAEVRMAVGGIGPKPQRLAEIESKLTGAEIAGGAIERAADLAVPLVNSRTRQEYRREVVHGLVVRALINAARHAGTDVRAVAPQLEASYA